MNDSDTVNLRTKEIHEAFNGSKHKTFVKTYNLKNDIYIKRSLIARYIDFCNDNQLKQDKKISRFLIKFDIRNGLTWNTCLTACLLSLPDIQCLKVEIAIHFHCNNSDLSFFRKICIK